MQNSAGIMNMHSGGGNIENHNSGFKTPEIGIHDQEANKQGSIHTNEGITGYSRTDNMF